VRFPVEVIARDVGRGLDVECEKFTSHANCALKLTIELCRVALQRRHE
jgi:hypothetical protein